MAALITEEDIERLDNQAFPRVLNAVIIADADAHRVALNGLDLTLRATDPDAGIDGRVTWPAVTHDLFFEGENVIQYKTGALSATDLREEFQKLGVQEALANQSHYILMVGRAHVPVDRDKRVAELAALCAAQGMDPTLCRIVFGDQIARWISRFPAIVIRPELGKPYPGFVTVENWRQQLAMRNPFHADASRQAMIEQIRGFIRSDAADNLIRIEGPAGVGKTRVVLEALSDSGLAERALYCPLADDPNAQDLMSALQGRYTTAIVVLDECDADRQATLRPYAEGAGAGVRVICIGIADKPFEGPAVLTQVLLVRPLPAEEIRAILLGAYASAPAEATDAAVRLSSGYVKLAMFVAAVLASRPDYPLTDLPKILDIRTFLRKLVDPATQKSIQALSLLARVGWEGPLQNEAQSLARAVNLGFDQLQDAVAKLKDQGIVLPRGRYLYVSPDLLAISAAAELWDARGADLITIVSDLPGPEPRRQLLLRLAVMSDHPEVRKALERLLSEQGLYRTLGDLDQAFQSEIFRLLSSALPEFAVATLERLIGTASRDDLLGFRTGRRNVMWALESLLRWSETSLRAARILRQLALAENEDIGNNATGVFQTYFHAFLSGSPVPLKDRLELVWELARSPDALHRGLAVKAASAALEFFESRMGGDIDYISKRPFAKEWRPKTFGELWEARRIAVQQLSVIAEGNDEAARAARNELLQSVFTLNRDGAREDAVRLLNQFRPRNDNERRQLLDVAQRLRRDSAELLSDEKKSDLDDIMSRTFGTTYFDRLRRWVGKRVHSDFDTSSPTDPFRKAEEAELQLAEEGYAKGLTAEEIAWLSSPEAENVWLFGRKLGELDTSRQYFDEILRNSPADLNCMLLSSYLVGLANREGENARDEILDRLAENNPTLAFAATWRGTATEASGRRIVLLIESGHVERHFYRALMYGGWVSSLPQELRFRIIALMLGGDVTETIEAVLSLLEYYTRGSSERFAVVSELVWRALERTPVQMTSHVEWEWGELARRAGEHDPTRVAKLVLDRMKRDDRAYISGDPLVQVLAEATKLDPEGVWKQVGAALTERDAFGYRLLLALEKWYGELLPTQTLIQWARENEPRGATLAARLVAIGAPLSERARALVLSFPDNPNVLNVFAANLQSGSWVGPISGHYESLLATVEQWKVEPDPRISGWARRLEDALKQQIKHYKVVEEEEEL